MMSLSDYVTTQKYLNEGLFKILGLKDTASLGEWLKDRYVENKDELARMAHACELDQFYEGAGEPIMDKVIDLAFNDQKNRARRKQIESAGLTKFNNFIARVAQEKATVYSEPARRTVANPEENVRYQDFVDLIGMDETMRELDRRLAFHEDALLWYRVRQRPDGSREPVLDVVSPASFWAVSHPNDRTMLVAIILDQRQPLAKPEEPAYRVWTHDQTFQMNGKCQVFESTIESWTLGVMPGVLCSTRKPGAKSTLLAQCPSADLLSAQKAIRLQDIGLSKESISANKQGYVSGDTSAAVMGQQADSDNDIIVPEGVTVTTVDRGVDPQIYRDNGDYIADSAAANHGLPPSVLHQRDATSGAEIELRRIPIRELRKQRIPIMRRIEHAIARVISLVNSARDATVIDAEGKASQVIIEGDLMELSFSMQGWSIDFGEVQQVMAAAEEDAVFSERRQLGLTNTLDEIKRRNPDLRSDEEARALLQRNIDIETERVRMMKELMAMNGSMGASTETVAGNAPTPFQANRGKPNQSDGKQADLKSIAKGVLDASN